MIILAVAAAAALVLSHTAPFPFLLELFHRDHSLWRVALPAGQPPTIFLTFDDGPNPVWTPPLLDVLREQDVRATFFLIDEHITAETAPIVRRMSEEGHGIALHSGSRKPMIQDPHALAISLARAADRIRSITGAQPCPLFRPHAGWRSATMYEALERNGYRLAGWSWRKWDWDWWRRPSADALAKRLARTAAAGDIIVIHDGHHKNPRADRPHAPATVRLLIPSLRARGFRFQTLCQAVGLEGPEQSEATENISQGGTEIMEI